MNIIANLRHSVLVPNEGGGGSGGAQLRSGQRAVEEPSFVPAKEPGRILDRYTSIETYSLIQQSRVRRMVSR